MLDALNDRHISEEKILITPAQLCDQLPLSAQQTDYISRARREIADIIHGRDHRLLVIVGPCSIHDVEIAKEYARKLKDLSEKLADTLLIAMRVYFEKPRTTIGWKGLINDPNLNGQFDIETGLRTARKLLLDLTELELPLATEALDPISPQYLAECFSWSAIGSRTAESQTHREMASGLSMPVGFKNGADGSLDIAVNSMELASQVNQFMGINRQGQVSLIRTQGNPDCHIILRGGAQPNYDSVCVSDSESALAERGIIANLIIDCAHANSGRDYRRQPLIAQNVVNQILEGNETIIGLMLESNLKAGNQSPLNKTKAELEYGVSITDPCIDWNTTVELLNQIRNKLITILPMRHERRRQRAGQ